MTLLLVSRGIVREAWALRVVAIASAEQGKREKEASNG